MGQNGSTLRPVTTLPVPASTMTYTYEDLHPAVAAAPDGHLAILWHRRENDSTLHLDMDNTYLAIFDSEGNLTYGPLKLTNNALGSGQEIYNPAIAATDDNRFVSSWEIDNANGLVDNIWVASYATTGSVVRAPVILASASVSWAPVLNSLPGSRVVLTSQNINQQYFTVLDSSGNIVKAQTALNGPRAYETPDAVALRGDRLAFGWPTTSGVALVVYDSSFNIISAGQVTASNAYTVAGNSNLSITSDPAGHVILTWTAWSYNLLYALADNMGNFVIAPQPYLSTWIYAETSWNGQGNAPLTKFGDVPPTQWAAPWIESLADSGITGGCKPGGYCPSNPVTRAEMAVFLLRANGTTPPPATGTVFSDVPVGYWAADWIEELARQGITSGCAPGKYCPDATVTRDQMAVFLLRTKGISPVEATGTRFSDVPANQWAAKWIEELARRGVTTGCTSTQYCPDSPVTRDQMAVFLVRNFSLPFEAPLP